MTALEVQRAPTLHANDTVAEAVRALLASELPALPVVDSDGLLVGLFGEREFMAALLPGYVGELKYAGFVSGELDTTLETRAASARGPVSQHMNTERVSVPEDFSEVGLAEIFLHHRVLVIPVEREGRPIGVVTRTEFFRHLAERFLARAER